MILILILQSTFLDCLDFHSRVDVVSARCIGIAATTSRAYALLMIIFYYWQVDAVPIAPGGKAFLASELPAVMDLFADFASDVDEEGKTVLG